MVDFLFILYATYHRDVWKVVIAEETASKLSREYIHELTGQSLSSLLRNADDISQ